jgi:hypothetical protein
MSEAARIEIAAIIKRGGCHDPVITLRDEATLDLPPVLKSAVLRGSMTDPELEEVRRLCQELDDRNVGSLLICVVDRPECRREDLSDVGGFTLAMPVKMREALSTYCLTYKDGQFMLQGPDETVSNMRSVKTLANWFT